LKILPSGRSGGSAASAGYASTIAHKQFCPQHYMHRIADESSSIVTVQEKELQKYVFISRRHYTNWFLLRLFIKVFQADLAEFPGGKKASRLISKTNPRWQTTIQTGLIWWSNHSFYRPLQPPSPIIILELTCNYLTHE
jgi:hypothetical protein